jgi:hypothetical protein
MRRYLIALLLLLPLAVPAQKKSNVPDMAPDAGAFTDRDYRNEFFSFTYTRGLNWRWLEADELQKMRGEASEKAQTRLGAEAGQLASSRTHFLAVAMGPAPGTAVLITAEDLLMEPTVASAERYLDTVMAGGTFTPEPRPVEHVTIMGVPFVRRYFTQNTPGETVYHAMTVTVARRFALSFDAVAASREQLAEALKTVDAVQFRAGKK